MFDVLPTRLTRTDYFAGKRSSKQLFTNPRTCARAANVAGLIKTGAFKRQYHDHRLEWMIRSGGLQVVLEGLKQDNIRFNSEPSWQDVAIAQGSHLAAMPPGL
jgi:hypothetical protein